MNKNGPIIIIEDDIDDQQILADIMSEIGIKNEIVFFESAIDAVPYLNAIESIPFIILSDFNLPRMNGLELLDAIRASDNEKIKAIPFIFFTTAAAKSVISEAYNKGTQGFFFKPTSYSKLKDLITNILQYWSGAEGFE